MDDVTKAKLPFNVERVAYWLASIDSAKFFVERMPLALRFKSRREHLKHCVQLASRDGLYLEFGVFRGTSLSVIAKNVEGAVYGFDSFEGLPEDWTHFQRKGRFTLDGAEPQGLPENVSLVKGWFEESLPAFLEEHSGPVSFLHIDCDLYSSTKTVLTLLQDRITSGTVIVFDEYFNYPGWQEHEAKAFNEFVADGDREFEYVGFVPSHFAVSVVMK